MSPEKLHTLIRSDSFSLSFFLFLFMCVLHMAWTHRQYSTRCRGSIHGRDQLIGLHLYLYMIMIYHGSNVPSPNRQIEKEEGWMDQH